MIIPRTLIVCHCVFLILCREKKTRHRSVVCVSLRHARDMAELFEKIIAEGYYQPFGGLTEEQEQCRAFTQQHLEELLCARQREKYVKEVKVCACGYGPSDEDEPMDLSNFSQVQFFDPFTNDLVFFVDKFDFIVLCVAHGVCKIHPGFEERYMRTLITAMTFKHIFVPAAPEQVLDLRQPTTPRTVAETPLTAEERDDQFNSFVTRRRSFSKQVKSELAALEAEQYEAEAARGEHPTVFGWDVGVKPPPSTAAAA